MLIGVLCPTADPIFNWKLIKSIINAIKSVNLDRSVTNHDSLYRKTTCFELKKAESQILSLMILGKVLFQ